MNAFKNKKCQPDNDAQDQISDLVIVNRWCDSIGIHPITVWRWRKAGYLETININGHVYISKSQIADFEKRARAGEFSKKHATYSKKHATKTTT